MGRGPYDAGNPAEVALFHAHEALASSNGDPVHGTSLEEFLLVGMTLDGLLNEFRSNLGHYIAVLGNIRRVASMQNVDYEPARAEDFPQDVRALLANPLVMLRTKILPKGEDVITSKYAFAILADGTIVTSNEPKVPTVNPWEWVGQ